MMKRTVGRLSAAASRPCLITPRCFAMSTSMTRSRFTTSVLRSNINQRPMSMGMMKWVRRYSAQSAAATEPQDFSKEELEMAKQRHEAKKIVASDPKSSSSSLLQQKRIDELYHAANLYLSEEKWTQSEDKFSTILDLTQAPNNVRLDQALHGRVLINLAFVEQNLGKREKAQTHYEEGIEVLKKALGEEHHDVACALLNYAEVLAFQSKMEQAEAVSKKAIPTFEKNYGPKSELVGALLSNLGGYLCAQRKFEEAEPVLMKALDILEAALGRANEYTQSCLSNCARLLNDLGRKDDLQALKAKYASNDDTYLNLHDLDMDENDPRMQAMAEEFKTLSNARAFNAEGIMKSPSFHKDELKQFIREWEAKHKEKLDPTLIPSVLEELDAMPREELDKIREDALREFQSPPTDAANGPLTLDSIAEAIDSEKLEGAADEDDDDVDVEGGDDDDEEDEDYVETLGRGGGSKEDEELWKATEAHDRERANQIIDIDMTHVPLKTDDEGNLSKK